MDISAPSSLGLLSWRHSYPRRHEGPCSLIFPAQQVPASIRLLAVSSLLSANVSLGDLSVQVQSVYAPLVPSATAETLLLDQHGGYNSKLMVATAKKTRTLSCKLCSCGKQPELYLSATGCLTWNHYPGTGWWHLCR